MYDFILLDLDNTIFDFGLTEEKCFKRIIEDFSLSYDSEMLDQYRKINTSLWSLLEHGKTSKDVVLNTRFSEFFKLYNIQVDGERVEKQYRQYLTEDVDLVPNAKSTLF